VLLEPMPPTATVDMVVAAGTAAVVTPAGAEAGAGVPTTSSAEGVAVPVAVPVTVGKITWGTVR